MPVKCDCFNSNLILLKNNQLFYTQFHVFLFLKSCNIILNQYHPNRINFTYKVAGCAWAEKEKADEPQPIYKSCEYRRS